VAAVREVVLVAVEVAAKADAGLLLVAVEAAWWWWWWW
jgi:hypothetical protein